MILKNLRKSIILSLCTVMAVCMTACGDSKDDSYRIIKLKESSGYVTYTRDSKTEDVYENMNFENGDQVVTAVNSGATLSLDSDKFLYMGANTSIELMAEGDAKDSKTSITLHSGEITSEIQEKLSESSMYEIETSNATMAVQGTIFYVSYCDEKTIVYCEEGEIKITSGENTSILSPEEAFIIEGDSINPVPVEDIIDEMSEGTTAVLDYILDLQGKDTDSSTSSDSDSNTDSNSDEADLGYSIDDLANVEGEPTGDGAEIYCTCGGKVVCDIYTPSGYSLMGYGDIETEYGFRRQAVVFNPVPGTKQAAVASDGKILATLAFEGEYIGTSTDFQYEIFPLSPVNNGSECVLIKYSYFDETWQKTFYHSSIVMRYEECDGSTSGVYLHFQIDGESLDWTIEDYQRLAYETFGR